MHAWDAPLELVAALGAGPGKHVRACRRLQQSLIPHACLQAPALLQDEALQARALAPLRTISRAELACGVCDASARVRTQTAGCALLDALLCCASSEAAARAVGGAETLGARLRAPPPHRAAACLLWERRTEHLFFYGRRLRCVYPRAH